MSAGGMAFAQGGRGSSAGKRRRTSDEGEGGAGEARGGMSGELWLGGGSPVPWPATPVTAGGGMMFGSALSPTSIMSPMQSFHHEESLMAANAARNRCERELEAELSKSRDLARRLAASEAEARSMREDLEKERSAAVQREDELSRSLDQSREELRAVADAPPPPAAPAAGDREAELAEAREEAAGLRAELEAAKAQGELYRKRAEEGYANVTEALAKLAEGGAGGGGGAGVDDKVKELTILNKHLRASLEEARGEAEAAGALRRDVESLRRDRAAGDELRARNDKLSQLLASSTAEEAKMRGERDVLQGWKVSLAIGMPEEATPAEVVAAFDGLRATVLELEGRVSELEEKCRSLEKSRAAAQQEAAREAGLRGEADGRAQGAEGELVLERAKVARAQGEVADLRLMMGSFKAEEALVRDDEVQSLRKRLGEAEAAAKEAAAAHASELGKARAEAGRVGEAARREREGARAAQAALQKQKSDVQALLDEERSQAAAARTKAAENERVLRAKHVDADRQAKLKAAELEKAGKAHSEELSKAQQEAAEGRAAADKAAAEKAEADGKLKTAKAAMDVAVAQRRKAEDLERVLPALVGVSVGGTYRKAADKAAREMLLTVKCSLARAPDLLLVRASVPAGDAAAPVRLQVHEAPKGGRLAELAEKLLTPTAGTPAEHAGIPRLLACLVTEESDRIIAEAAKEAEEAGGGEGEPAAA